MLATGNTRLVTTGQAQDLDLSLPVLGSEIAMEDSHNWYPTLLSPNKGRYMASLLQIIINVKMLFFI